MVEENGIIEETSPKETAEETIEAAVPETPAEEPTEVKAKPVARRRAPVRRRTTAAAKTEAATADEKNAAEPAEASTEVVEPQVEPAEASPCDVELPIAPAGPAQHPGILHVKELIQTATINLARTERLTPKLTKQFGKLDSALDKAHKRLRNVRLKDAARAEKYIIGLREHLTLLAENDALSPKKIDIARKSIRSLRQKLSDIKKR